MLIVWLVLFSVWYASTLPPANLAGQGPLKDYFVQPAKSKLSSQMRQHVERLIEVSTPERKPTIAKGIGRIVIDQSASCQA